MQIYILNFSKLVECQVTSHWKDSITYMYLSINDCFDGYNLAINDCLGGQYALIVFLWEGTF